MFTTAATQGVPASRLPWSKLISLKVKSTPKLWNHSHLRLNPDFLLTDYVTLSLSFQLSQPLFPHLEKVNTNNAALTGPQ